MHLDRQDVFAFFEGVDIEQRNGFELTGRFVIRRGRCIEGGWSAFSVAAGYLDAVDVGDEAVIVVHVEGHGTDRRQVVDLKSMPQVDSHVGVFHVVEDCSNEVESISIAEAGGGYFPLAGVKILKGPTKSRGSLFVGGRFILSIGVERDHVAIDSAAFEDGVIDAIGNEHHRAILLGKRSPGGKKNEETSKTVQNSHSVPPGINSS